MNVHIDLILVLDCGHKIFLTSIEIISRFSRHLPGGLGHYCMVLAKIVPCTCPPHAHHTPNLVTLPNNKLSVCVCVEYLWC